MQAKEGRPSRPQYDSHQETFDHAPMHVGEAVVAALELEGQPGVIDAEAVQHGGVQIVDVHGSRTML